MEAFHMGVPVLAYAATAVPATMDGAGVLYTDKDPLRSGGAHQRGRGRPGAPGADHRRTGRRARPARGAGLRRDAAALRRSDARDAEAPAPAGGVRLLGPGRMRPRSSRRSRRTGHLHFWRCQRVGNREPGAGNRLRSDPDSRLPAPAMIVNQWVPAAHKGDAIGDSARRVRDPAARDGSRVGDLRAHDRRRPAQRGPAVRGSRGEARRPDDLSLRAGVAAHRGVCQPAPRPRAAVSQRDAGALLRSLRCRTSSAWPRSGART